MTIYGYKDQELNLDEDYPQNTYLVWELESLNMYYVSHVDNTKLYHLDVSTGTRTLITTRTQSIQAAWHDRTNKIIYLLDCDNPGDAFDVWTVDYSSSETSPTITSIGSSSGADSGTVYAHDILRYNSNTYVVNHEQRTNEEETKDFEVFWLVNSTPFTEKDKVEVGII